MSDIETAEDAVADQNYQITELRGRVQQYQQKLVLLENERSHSLIPKSAVRFKVMEIIDVITDGNPDVLRDDQRTLINSILLGMGIGTLSRSFRLNVEVAFEPITVEIEVEAGGLTEALQILDAGLYDKALMDGKEVSIASISLNGHSEGPKEKE